MGPPAPTSRPAHHLLFLAMGVCRGPVWEVSLNWALQEEPQKTQIVSSPWPEAGKQT